MPRIVSLNLGTDEILFALAPPEQIVTLSSYVDDARLSCMAEAAKAVPVKLHDKSPERVLVKTVYSERFADEDGASAGN